LVSAAKKAREPSDHRAIADQAIVLFDEAIAKDDYGVLKELEDLLLPESRASGDRQFMIDVKARVERHKALAKNYEAMRKAQLVLDKTPDDPDANLTVGRYYCFMMGNWDKGLPMLAVSSDENLKSAALKDIAPHAIARDRVAIGDLWRGLADKEKEAPSIQKKIRARARHWYELALPDSSGLAKVSVEKRISDLESAETVVKTKPEAKVKPRNKVNYQQGLVAEIYNDTHCLNRVTSRIDSKIDFDWGNKAPDPAVANCFYSIRWRGYINVKKSGDCTFITDSCNGVRLLIDNDLLIDRNTANGNWNVQADTKLNAGYHTIEVQFMHSQGNSYCHVNWQPFGAKAPAAIDANSLFHDAPLEQSAGIGQR
jgi:hypothetical protein